MHYTLIGFGVSRKNSSRHYSQDMAQSLLEASWLCSDVKNTHPLHIEPVAALCADDANEYVVTGRTAHYRSHVAHIDGERTNRPGGAAMPTRFLNERHFKRENFSQDAACGIPIECRIVH